MGSRWDDVHWAADCLRERVDSATRRADKDDPCREGYEQAGTKEKDGRTVPNCVEADAVATAEQERKWIVRGEYPNGGKLQFTVLAFDYADAKKKAEAKKGGGKITDIVLKD